MTLYTHANDTDTNKYNSTTYKLHNINIIINNNINLLYITTHIKYISLILIIYNSNLIIHNNNNVSINELI